MPLARASLAFGLKGIPCDTVVLIEDDAATSLRLADVRRLLEPLSYIPPAEAEANYYKQLSSPAIPA